MYDGINHVYNYDFLLRSLREYEEEVNKLRELNAELTEELYAARALAKSALDEPVEPAPNTGYVYEA